MFVMNKHLINENGEDKFVMETPEQRDSGLICMSFSRTSILMVMGILSGKSSPVL